MAKYHSYDKSGKIKTDVGDITFDSLKADMDKLRADGAKRKIVDPAVTNIGTTTGGREIYALKIGRDSSKRILLVGCHHAREWISVEVPFLVGKYLIENYKEKKDAKTTKEKRINYLVDNAETWIVPMLNPDGHNKTLTKGEGLWRPNTNKVTFPVDTPIERWVEKAPYHTEKRKIGKNTFELKFYRLAPTGTGKKEVETVPKGVYEGVDLNRNYPVPAGPKGAKAPPWGTETFSADPSRPGGFIEVYDLKGKLLDTVWSLTTSKSPDPPDTFCGPAAGSEKEVKALVDLIGKGNFKCIISYHNFGQLLLFPDDAAKDDGVQFLGKGMDELFDDQKAPYDYESGSGLYPTSGDTIEWAYRAHTLPNYTIELPPTATVAKAKDWSFNKFPDTEIDSTFKHNLPVALCAINCAISGLVSGPMKAVPKGKKASLILNCWKVFKGWTP